LTTEQSAVRDSWPRRAVLLVDALTRPVPLGLLRRMRRAAVRGAGVLLAKRNRSEQRKAARVVLFCTGSFLAWWQELGLAELLRRVSGLQRLAAEILEMLRAELQVEEHFVALRVLPCLDRLSDPQTRRAPALAELSALVTAALRLTAVCHEKAT